MSDNQNIDIIYVGDPMCSWCYGFAKELVAFADHINEQGYGFNILVGGLRTEVGQVWDDEFKGFLKHHWAAVNERSGQPFSHKLFDQEYFDYNTEPVCRAVVTAKYMMAEKGMSSIRHLGFFELSSEKFYNRSEDPKEASFYQEHCEKFELDFDKFEKLFASDEMKAQTQNEFNMTRSWGVNSYPSVLLLKNQQLTLIGAGYTTKDEMIKRLEAQI